MEEEDYKFAFQIVGQI